MEQRDARRCTRRWLAGTTAALALGAALPAPGAVAADGAEAGLPERIEVF